jgi:hypothetical protein
MRGFAQEQNQTRQGDSVNRAKFRLSIDKPGDRYEREADRVAERVMRMPGAAANPRSPLRLQRLCVECEEEEGSLQRQVQMDAQIHPDITQKIQAVRNGNGRPLNATERNFFEPRFGFDFGKVRIHSDDRADAAARAVAARAYTAGSDIVLRSGAYAPGTQTGQRLLAHELTHVVQQGEAKPLHVQQAVEGRGPADELDRLEGHIATAGPLFADSITHLGHEEGERVQRLSVSSVGASLRGACGQRRHRWLFELSSPAPADGYIVQQVGYTEVKRRCNERPVRATPANPDRTFWEAWFVRRGDTKEHQHASFGYTDQTSLGSNPDTSGVNWAAGTIKFFTTATTGDLGRDNVAPATPNGGWGPGAVPITGSLPSTSTLPPWWGGTPTEGPGTRFAQSSWDCCVTDPNDPYFGFNDIQLYP